MKKRTEYFAYVANESSRVIGFTRHFSKFAAEKHYGDLSRHYRGSAASDFDLTIYAGREKMESDLAGHYKIDYKTRTLTPRKI